MKKFLIMPVKVFAAFAALTLLTGAAKSTPAPQDTKQKVDNCHYLVKDKAQEKRTKLIRGMI